MALGTTCVGVVIRRIRFAQNSVLFNGIRVQGTVGGMKFPPMIVSMCLFMLRGKEKAEAVVMGSYEMALGGLL